MINNFIKAVAFAAEKHKTQRRKDADASPYINHPIALANVLANEGGIANQDVLIAAILHDTIEDTETSEAELRKVFGDKVASLVLEVTDDKSLAPEVRKLLQIEHAAKASHGAKLVKLADKISNLRDMLSSPPADWPKERIAKYFDWASNVIAGLRGTNAELEKIFDGLISEGKSRFA
jgi:GTP diphosphokinase / guanosine-3',5'-bis(diphosphate) 3'-diphosphatase